LFKQKVMKGMSSSENHPMDGKVDVDETYVRGQDENALGRNEGKKQIMVVAVERKGRGVSRIYGRVSETASRKHLKRFMLDHIAPGAEVRTDRWSGYSGLESEFPKLVWEKSKKKGKNFPQLHRTVMLFKAWLRGIHHSVLHLQPYIDEYPYRFNRHKMKEGIFENLMKRMVEKTTLPIHTILFIIRLVQFEEVSIVL